MKYKKQRRQENFIKKFSKSDSKEDSQRKREGIQNRQDGQFQR